MNYLGDPQDAEGGPDRLGVLVANLGTPDSPDPGSVRRFLAEFLWDPRVVEAPRSIWWLALNVVILRIRPRRSSHAYRQIWTPAGSPLLVNSRALTAAIRERLDRMNAAVALGMTYGSPSIPAALDELRRAGVRRLVVLPLYPQYSGTTTASVFDRVTSELQRWRWTPELRFINHYHDEPAYIDALSASIAQHWRERGGERPHLLFSFHGIPKRYVAAGDPYYAQCLDTARRTAAKLALAAEAWTMSFQSQVGREEWLRPYTDEQLIGFARGGRKRVTVVCPGFATDCLETLEEIALRNREAFLASGGQEYEYVPALNEDPAHADLLAALIERHASGWGVGNAASDAGVEPRRALEGGAR